MARRAGTKTYHAAPCKRCGTTERYVKSDICIHCNVTLARPRQYAWMKRTGLRFRKYGITKEHFDAMLAAQGNKCEGCGAAIDGSGRTSIDHDHNTGKVRGLLCHPCNMALGIVKESVETLLRLGVYLEKHRG